MRCLGLEPLDTTLSSLLAHSGTLSSAGPSTNQTAYSFICSCIPFIHLAHIFQMLTLFQAHCWALASRTAQVGMGAPPFLSQHEASRRVWGSAAEPLDQANPFPR